MIYTLLYSILKPSFARNGLGIPDENSIQTERDEINKILELINREKNPTYIQKMGDKAIQIAKASLIKFYGIDPCINDLPFDVVIMKLSEARELGWTKPQLQNELSGALQVAQSDAIKSDFRKMTINQINTYAQAVAQSAFDAHGNFKLNK